MVLLNVSVVLLDFLWFLHGFSQSFHCFIRLSNSFTRFFHGLMQISMVLLDFSIVFFNFSMVLLDFSIILPFHSSLPKCTSEDGPGGNRYPNVTQLPPGTEYNPQKSSNCHASTAPNSVILCCPRPLYPQTPYNSLCSQKELRLA